ncbi:multidrug transporter AcrB [Acinetobacter proteolyticus]|jgi:multidrug efflux pump|uniref:AcrB/AcrD/AcrF family protein n=1 Tax=Acinetobacter proteolyticus TaxID=1776741 RepID=A0A653K373_9GAMM|nr:efflux RND transporter permease subunit [Acinetobacter proteolyticus]OEY96826.1 multidrug transporter AcrB [Acinetobacter proteolyticus]PKF34369.1 AcrB/AcrD/AcrF family protein [Acinetobacter proteolyticus]QHH93628.1 efflux RND transporter permease subunit [Acinetobacter gyllenbergii]VXA54932.1 putative efflux transporter causing drug resistance (Acr family) [Acinetobacter proteolyticus]
MKFNLSEWALKNKGIILYFMLLLGIVGIMSYSKLSQSEDPPFTFKVMVVQTYWPGATAKEVSTLVTDRIEKELMTTGQYDRIMAYSRPGESLVTFVAKDSLPSSAIPDVWYNVRKKVNDIRSQLPSGVQGPFFNDEFGDTFGNIYVLTGKDFDYAVMKEYADRLQLQLQRVKDVNKVNLVGLQDQKIWIELSNTKAVQLGVPVTAIQEAIQKQNDMAGAGFFETGTDRIQIRVSGHLHSVEDLKKMPLLVGDKTIQLGDVADVYRGFSEPAQPRMRFMGENGIGIAVSMRKGGDIIALGKNLETEFNRLQKTLPLGMKLQKVSDQPVAVQRSIQEFLKVLAEAVIIVLLVSFFSLGFRTGLVVALSIPLVLAMTFAGMNLFDVGLHKISLGALILALGLLVDDAIIAVEMMAIKMEQGYSRLKAAGFAWQTTAFPMLTGTLITAAGFLPIATAQSGTGEYTRSIFQVVTIALIVSWIAAVLFVPYLGEKLLPDFTKQQQQAAWYVRLWARLRKQPAPVVEAHGQHHDPYQSKFYQSFRRVVEVCITYRKTVIAVTVGIFVLSVAMFKLVPQQFFPPSNRAEILVDLKLEEGASLTATEQAVHKVEQFLSKQQGIDNYVAYVGTGSPRFYLPLDQQLPQASFAQFVVLASSLDDRDEIRRSLDKQIKQLLPQVRTRVSLLENGPPVGYPLQYRVSGEDLSTVRQWAQKVAKVLSEDPNTTNVHLDWGEPSKIIAIEIDQDRARQMGVSSVDLANFLNASVTGAVMNQYREKRELIEIRLRGDKSERVEVASLASLAVPTSKGTTVPLAQIANIESRFEEGLIWHRNRLPTITVRADIRTHLQPATVVQQLADQMQTLRADLPSGYLLEVGGTVEESAKGQNSVNAGMPLFLAVVMTLLMIQLRSMSRATIVLLTAPLGLIGVVAFLLLFNKPFGFVAMLGTIALSGMIMRNSLILIDQIEQDILAGHEPWEAVIGATMRRFRPIVLTALAAVLAMIPLSRSIFFGPMAVAIMGGLIVATLLTLFFLPALYAAWFKVKKTTQLS